MGPDGGTGNHDDRTRTSRMTQYTVSRMQMTSMGRILTLEAKEIASLELVEEAPFDQPFPLLGGHLQVGRREQVDPLRHHLDLPVQAEDQARGEVHQPTGRRVFGPLQVHDHRYTLAVSLPDLASLVEPPRLRAVDGSHRSRARRHGPDDGLGAVDRTGVCAAHPADGMGIPAAHRWLGLLEVLERSEE